MVAALSVNRPPDHMKILALTLVLLVFPAGATPAGPPTLPHARAFSALAGLFSEYGAAVTRLDMAIRTMVASNSSPDNVAAAVAIRESYKKSMLIANNIHDILAFWANIDKNLATVNAYAAARLHDCRLGVFSALVDAETALATLRATPTPFPEGDLALVTKRIRTLYELIAELEPGFSGPVPAAAGAEAAGPAPSTPARVQGKPGQ